jgi:hypothetical protein
MGKIVGVAPAQKDGIKLKVGLTVGSMLRVNGKLTE